MSKWLCLTLGVVFLILTDVGSAWAGKLKIVPVRLYVNPRDKSAVLELTNEDKRNLTIQLDVRIWSQDDAGVDHFDPTTDIVFFPKIVTIKPDQSQIVRLGIRGRPNPDAERTYRFFIEELPVERPGGSAVLRFAFKISLPIFILPVKPITNWEISKATIAGRAIVATVTNHGNEHIFVSRVDAKAADAAGVEVFSGKSQGSYVLRGRSHSYELPLPEAACPDVRRLDLSAAVGSGSTQNEFSVEPNPTQCEAPPDRTSRGGGGGAR